MPTTHDIPFEEVKPVYLPVNSKLTDNIVQQLDLMFDFVSPAEYRDTLIELYHWYILHEHVALPEDFKDKAGRMIILLDWLKEADRELGTGS